MKTNLPCIAIAGPTASGKTAAALHLAEELKLRGLQCEIISVDSALVYKNMDIGTAKPSKKELALVPHHLIDMIEPHQNFSAAAFTDQASALIEQIRQREAIPLLVGGTMLYFKALMCGIDDMPPADPQIRQRLDEEAALLGWPHLHQRLSEVDPQTAQRLAPADSQRIQRALEVWELTGRPLSSFHRSRKNNHHPSDDKNPIDLLISLEPQERSWLHERIAQRFDAMLQDGFLDEVRDLRRRYPQLHADLPSMRCVGYRQAWQALENEKIHAKLDIEHLRQTGIAATRQLAKRQITWLRSMPERRIIDCCASDAAQQAASLSLSLSLSLLCI